MQLQAPCRGDTSTRPRPPCTLCAEERAQGCGGLECACSQTGRCAALARWPADLIGRLDHGAPTTTPTSAFVCAWRASQAAAARAHRYATSPHSVGQRYQSASARLSSQLTLGSTSPRCVHRIQSTECDTRLHMRQRTCAVACLRCVSAVQNPASRTAVILQCIGLPSSRVTGTQGETRFMSPSAIGQLPSALLLSVRHNWSVTLPSQWAPHKRCMCAAIVTLPCCQRHMSSLRFPSGQALSLAWLTERQLVRVARPALSTALARFTRCSALPPTATQCTHASTKTCGLVCQSGKMCCTD